MSNLFDRVKTALLSLSEPQPNSKICARSTSDAIHKQVTEQACITISRSKELTTQMQAFLDKGFH